MRHDTTGTARLLLVVADGVRADVLEEEMDAGRAPAMAALRAKGSSQPISSSFPSVTGPAYVPFLMGHHPARVGLPGLRWYDRTRSLRWAPAQSRSYAGWDIWHVDSDVSPHMPTMLEYAQPSIAAMSMIGRGATHGRIGRGLGWMARAAPSHFRGDLLGWRTVERQATAAFLKQFGKVRPRFSVLAITSPDKFAHKFGARSDAVRTAIRDVDDAIGRAQELARRGGWGESLHIWVTGDHGHAPVADHDDLHGWLESEGHRVLAHPRLNVKNPDVVLMVGGNAMAHLYMAPAHRSRQWWGEHAARWDQLLDRLIERPSIDLMAISTSDSVVQVRHAARGVAEVRRTEGVAGTRWSYVPLDGDPLLLGGAHQLLDSNSAWALSSETAYPDALVQLSWLGASSRGGDVVLSASEGWDLRARFEPVAHISTHGALLRDQMLVPLIVDVATARRPQRTTDIVPSALQLLGVHADTLFDGQSFLR
ncbi:alkaline phosphatase family protein [Gemmatimonas phototrophica]|uniref:alkaline phosphatase family protein n=1 Tax=Gemmatimonas phototrophica TaxID=1379270 RepID=UPI0009EE0D81|nr:alkaline phosphatase family protein [Gemmatimonas phototrophica]